ncbi:hypothetical protein AWJ20_5111 [Sugiyamaella lignohabitans]|uniref:Uncharacterized protein n=1 Tax=Sugiyamaella lignohabitans TaxID=796027 RepID=A0A167EJF5_9ASCO|nr:uncharacterized protein AWJ20_5111 [Sugiyamaella lignohabitans]ANB14152.1 hypothetical protein AWJ20_5111 [Sugiyamaella lignohabitans]
MSQKLLPFYHQGSIGAAELDKVAGSGVGNGTENSTGNGSSKENGSGSGDRGPDSAFRVKDSHSQTSSSRQRVHELPLSLDPSLSFTRKRDCPTSESLIDGQNKRFHEFTDGQGPASEIWEVRSSPPLPPGLDTDEDDIDTSFELTQKTADDMQTSEDIPYQPRKKRFFGVGSTSGSVASVDLASSPGPASPSVYAPDSNTSDSSVFTSLSGLTASSANGPSITSVSGPFARTFVNSLASAAAAAGSGSGSVSRSAYPPVDSGRLGTSNSRSASCVTFVGTSSFNGGTGTPTTPPVSKSSFTSPTLASPFSSLASPIKRHKSYTRAGSFTSIADGHFVKAQEIIANAIDEGASKIVLSNMDLTEVPVEIGDLQNLVLLNSDSSSGDPDFHIFLNGNNIKTLPSALFNISNITVLSLRANQLAQLPPSIGRLKRLVNLSIAQNNLTYLPIELLELDHLDIFTFNANQFLQPPASTVPRRPPTVSANTSSDPTTASTSSYPPILTATSTAHISFALKATRQTQSLSELCLVQVAHHVISEREINLWDLDPGIKKLVSQGVDSRDSGVTCGICKRRMVHGIGYVLEWWANFKGVQDHLPFRRDLCSFRCYDKWSATHLV